MIKKMTGRNKPPLLIKEDNHYTADIDKANLLGKNLFRFTKQCKD